MFNNVIDNGWAYVNNIFTTNSIYVVSYYWF